MSIMSGCGAETSARDESPGCASSLFSAMAEREALPIRPESCPVSHNPGERGTPPDEGLEQEHHDGDGSFNSDKDLTERDDVLGPRKSSEDRERKSESTCIVERKSAHNEVTLPRPSGALAGSLPPPQPSVEARTPSRTSQTPRAT